jgi:hypothetical protein
MEAKGVCEVAQELVGGSRVEEYGDPVITYRRVGQMWGWMLGRDAIPADVVAMMMVAVKLGREMNKHKRDNLVDMCGYAEIADMAWARR